MSAERAVALLLLALLLSACRAAVVELRGPVPGPVPEVGLLDAGGGRVRYALKGPRGLVRRRREDALAKMAAHCGGASRVRLEREWTQEDTETPYGALDLEETVAKNLPHYKVESYRHLEFACMEAPRP